ncbi:MAG: hypothetical protein IT495_22060 [Gammaproteobacteria bacterium]|nr:hypothetical protein [Gammaproteobacteria bacterium]
MTRRAAPRPVDAVVATRLAPPRYAGRLVSRDDLLATLHAGRGGTLTLVVAPAGFGKTTLLAQWRRELMIAGFSVAWVAIEEGDDEETQFLSCLTAALDHAGIDAGRGALDVLNRIHGSNPETVAGVLVNELAELPGEICVVLDDFHHLHSAQVIGIVQHLLVHAPAGFHLAIATRTAPPLKLADLRLRGALTQIDFRQLRFGYEQARVFLAERLREEPAPDLVERLWRETDGWVAGLQLAAIALRSGDLAPAALDSGAYARNLADYLTERVLDGLPADVLEFMLRTSVCERFNDSLCAALTGRADAGPLLRQIEAENLFVLPIEDAGDWYRFHPLFAEYLRKRLGTRTDLEARALHRAACRWFRDCGQPIEAARHALEAGDTDAAVDLVAASARSLVEQGQYKTLVQWAQRLPEARLARCRGLALDTAFALAMCFRFDDAGRFLDLAGHGPPDPQQFAPQAVRGIIAVFGDHIDAALAYLPAWVESGRCDDPLAVCAACNVLTYAYTEQGEFERARQIQVSARRFPESARSPAELVYSRSVLGLSHAAAGEIKRAETCYREALARAESGAGRRSFPASFAAALLAEVLYETNRLEAVEAVLAGRLDVVADGPIPAALNRAFVSYARTRAARGAADEALIVLERMQARGEELGLIRVLAIALAERIRVFVLLGDQSTAAALQAQLDALAARAGDAAADAAADVRTHAVIGHARIAAGGDPQAGIVDRLRAEVDRANAAQRRILAVRCGVLLAVVLARLGHDAQARVQLRAAAGLARGLGVLRTLIDEPGSARLIDQLARRAPPDMEPAERKWLATLCTATAPPGSGAGALVTLAEPQRSEALKDREREVLRLLACGFSNKKIASTMSVSVETVKWYLKQIYPKLGVSGRGRAVDCARARGLI